MAVFKFNHYCLLCSCLLLFLVFQSIADAAAADDDDSSSPLLEHLYSKIQTLEHQVGQRIKEITEKDNVIAAKDKLIKEKLDRTLLLEAELSSLKNAGNLNVVEEVGKVQARASELEKRVVELQRDIDFYIKEEEALKLRLTGAERKASELNSKLNSLQKIIDGQKIELHKATHTLRLAEEELTMVKFEATSKDSELLQVHNAWLPHWLSAHLIRFQTLLEKNWKIHGKPTMELLRQKAIENEAHFKEWAAQRVEMVKTELVPAVKEQWVVSGSNMESHAQAITMKTIELYDTSKKTVTPHIITLLEVVDPYFQHLMGVSKPYIDQVTTATKPHVDALHAALKPYIQQAIQINGKLFDSATVYHNHVQDRVELKLKSYESTKPLATKELIWVIASALLALPVILLLKVISVVFGKSTRKPMKHTNTIHSRWKSTEHQHAPSTVQKGSGDCIPENRTITKQVYFYQDIIYTTVTSDHDIASQWIFDLYASHREPHIMVGLDIEWRPPHTNPVATLQLCVANRCLILQLVHCRHIPFAITDFLASPDNVFVGVGIKFDLEKLQADYGFGLNANAVDLKEEVAMAYERPELMKASLKTLAAVVLGKEVEKLKSVTISDWDGCRLTKLQISYACIDAFVCHEIGRSLIQCGYKRGLLF